MSNASGSFAVIPLFLIAVGVFLAALVRSRSGKEQQIYGPYMSGISGTENGTYIGPMNKVMGSVQSNYYLSALFGEEKLSRAVNTAACALIAVMLGVSFI